MRTRIAARMDQLVPSGIRKVNEKALEMERAGETVYHFEIGRPDFDTPEYIKRACIESLENGEVFYTSNFGMMELRQTIADYLNRRSHTGYQAENILVTTGLSEAVFDLLCTILDEGDELLRLLAEVLRESFRATDAVGRFGGSHLLSCSVALFYPINMKALSQVFEVSVSNL